MAVLSLTSFLCTRTLVDFLDQIICSLKFLLNKNDPKQSSRDQAELAVITQDRLGEVASLVNKVTSHIYDISLFRRTIEVDETVEEVYRRLAYVFKEKLHLDTFIIWEIQEKNDSIEPVYSWPPELQQETCSMSSSRVCRARRNW